MSKVSVVVFDIEKQPSIAEMLDMVSTTAWVDTDQPIAEFYGFVPYFNHKPSPEIDPDFSGDFSNLNDKRMIRLCLRTDTRKIAGAVMKEAKEKAYADYLAENPDLTKIAKTTREEINEKVLLDLLGKTIPAPKFVDAIIYGDRLYILSASPGEIDRMISMLVSTFPGFVCRRRKPLQILREVHATALSNGFEVEMPEIVNASDFLPWLLAIENDTEDLPTPFFMQDLLFGEFMGIYNRVTLSHGKDEDRKIVITGDLGLKSEVRTAIQAGASILESGIVFGATDTEWSMRYDPAEHSIRSLSLPTAVLDEDPENIDLYKEAAFLDQLYMIDKGVTLLESALKKHLWLNNIDKSTAALISSAVNNWSNK